MTFWKFLMVSNVIFGTIDLMGFFAGGDRYDDLASSVDSFIIAILIREMTKSKA